MNISFLTVITAICGLMYSYVSIQRDHSTPVLNEVLLAITLFGAVVLFVEIVNRFTTGTLQRTNKQVPSDLLRLTTSIVLYSVFGLLILRFVYKQDISALLATSAVLSVALGLALREPLGHIFSGLTLEIARPLSVGDYIKANNLSGCVEALSWRAVHVRTKDHSMIVFPNSRLADNSIEIFPRDLVCTHYMDVAYPNDIAPTIIFDAAKEVLSGSVPYVADSKSSTIQATRMDPEKGAILYRIRFGTTEYFKLDAIRTVLMERLWYALARRGIDPSLLGRNHYLDRPTIRDADNERAVNRFAPRERFLKTIPEFLDLQRGSIEHLARHFVRVSYAKGENIDAHVRRPRSLFIIQNGRVLMSFAGAVKAVTREIEPVETNQAPRFTDSSHWDGHILEEITGQLVQVMGPVSRYLVETESSYTNDRHALYHRLAAHLDDDDDRAAFLGHCPIEQSESLEAGSMLCHVPRLDGKVARRRLVALDKTDLLELSREGTDLLPLGDGELAKPLASLFARAAASNDIQLVAS